MIQLHQFRDGRLRRIAFEGLDRLPDSDWVWLDVLTSDPAEISAVGAVFGFDRLSLEDVVIDMLPKLDGFESYRYAVFHGLTFEAERIGTSEVDMFVADDVLVTVHSGESAEIDWVLEHIESPHLAAVHSPGELAARIVEAVSRRFPALTTRLDERIVDLEERAMLADSTVIGEAQALRRDVVVLRRVFGPQRDVLRTLSVDETLDPATRRAFRDVYDHHFHFVESLDSARSLINGVHETHREAIGAHTNEVMRTLTVFSAVLLPLTLMSGIWGMNLALPWQGSPNGFAFVLGLMALVASGLWIYFLMRRFVGRPRLHAIPKPVGLRLSHLAAPERRGRADDSRVAQ